MGQSRSVSSIQQQMRRTGSREAVAALVQDIDDTEAERSTSPKDVTYKASERNSESSTHSVRSTDSDDGLRKASQHTSDDKLVERGLQSSSSESIGSVSAPVMAATGPNAVAAVTDALADWDPFFDADD
jgi:hypothetical protein